MSNKETNYNKVTVKNNMKVDTPKTQNDISKQERVKLEPLIDSAPEKRKRGLMSRLVRGVVGPEGLPGIGSFVAEEIIIPAIKNIVVDSVTSGVNKMVYGDSTAGRPRQYGAPPRNPYTHQAPRPTMNYTSRYTSAQPEPAPQERVVRGGRADVEEYIIADRQDAAHVLIALQEQADMYGNVSVADYYDRIGVPTEFTDNNYGWTIDTIVRASIRNIRGGYVIHFPPVEVL